MKQKSLLKTMLLLCALIAGSMNVWAGGSLVSSLSGITDGKTYYITAKDNSKYYTVPNTTFSGQTFTCTEATYADEVLTPATGAGEFVFTKVEGKTNAYYIYNTNLGKYLVATGSKQFGYVDSSSSDYGYWTFSDVSSGGFSGAFSVKHSSKTQYMRAYSNSVRCYDGTNNNGVYFFEKTIVIPDFEITAVSNNDSYGTVSLTGSVITATPATGYRISTSTPYEVTTGTATVVQSGNEFTVTPTTDCTVQINFEAIPKHTVTFYSNGIKLSDASVAEGADIVFPSATTYSGYGVVGWATSTIAGTTTIMPETVTEATMGTADVDYHAVYGTLQQKNFSIAFDADDLTDTPVTTGKLEWTHTASGIVLRISAGQHYTGSPKTFTVTKGTSNYFEIDTNGGLLTGMKVTITDGTYKINSVSTGASVSTSGTTQTITFSSDLSSVRCYATSGNQIRARKIEVDATVNSYDSYCTTITIPMKVTSAEWASFSSAEEIVIPAGVTAYYASTSDGSSVTLKEIETGIIPANEGVVINADEGTYYATISATSATNITGNLLKPWLTAGTPSESTYYTLAVNGTDPVFKKSTGGTLAAGKAYLVLSGSEARELTVSFEETTDIRTIENAQPTMGEGSVYDLSGRRVDNPTKGIYIMNGKKFVVK